jgi:hypothetical protein
LFSRGTLAASLNNSTYNIVQWGWSTNEENLIDNDPSYDPLENANILTNSGQANVIQNKYGKCFTDDIGTLLTDGSVNRDNDGNLQDSGLCSPSNLSYDSPDPLATDNNAESTHKQDLIFRWRLDQSYQSTLTELASIQNVNSSGATSQ